MNFKKIIVTLIVILLIVFLGINAKALLDKRKDQIANEPLPSSESISVKVIKPKIKEIEKKGSFLAQLKAQKSIKLSTKLVGFVQKVYVKEAQKVNKGDLLVQIDPTEILSSINELKRAIKQQKKDKALARTIYNSNLKLYEIGGISKEMLDRSKLILESKELTVKNTQQKLLNLKHQLSYLKIKAPFDGVIDAIFLHEGDLALASKPILALSSNEKKLTFLYAQTKDNKILKDQEVYSNNEKIGYIRAIYNSSENGLNVAEVTLIKEINLPLKSLLNIEVLLKKEKGCTVANDTLLHKKDGIFVMVYKDGYFKPLKVNLQVKDQKSAIISPCPTSLVAKGSEVTLAKLPAYENVKVIKAINE